MTFDDAKYSLGCDIDNRNKPIIFKEDKRFWFIIEPWAFLKSIVISPPTRICNPTFNLTIINVEDCKSFIAITCN
jgi:hypothetical protein